MIGGKNHHLTPTVDIPPWPYTDDQTVDVPPCPYTDDQTANMHFMLSPSENSNSTPNFTEDYSLLELENGEIELPVDMYACDNFRMFEFKVRNCARGRSHDWTECPYLHPGEKARRRDPRKYHYSGTACPDFRKGNCLRGDGCEFAHGVFECWLHPARYRTQPCKDGVNCKRRVCFFAHSADQLRVLSPNADSAFQHQSPRLCGRALQFVSSPESSSPPTESPPMSPMLSRSLGSNSVNDVMASLRQLQLNRLNSVPSAARKVQLGSPRLGSPGRPVVRPGFCSLPVTPTGELTRPGKRCFDLWEEEPVFERVESGRDLRVKMFERLSKENPLDGVNPNLNSDAPNPDVGWVSDLIQ